MDLARLLQIASKTCGLTKDRPVLVGVSGGPDSLCLLDILLRLEFSVIAAHFDHRLRPESADDSAYVQSIAARMGAPFVSGSHDVAAYAENQRMPVESAARALRYRFLFDQARKYECQAVAVGHTADDQVETVLMNLLAGSGMEGLTGMEYCRVLPVWDASLPLVRPLLAAWRSETVAYCQERGLKPLIDPSNSDPRYTRNRVRSQLVPLLETYNPQLRKAIWRMAQSLAGDEEIVQQAAGQAWQACLREQAEGCIGFSLPRLRDLPEGVQRRILRRGAEMLGADLRDLDYAATQRGLARINSTGGDGEVDLAGGLRLAVEGSTAWLVRAGAELPLPDVPFLPGEVDSAPLPVPGQLRLSNGWVFSVEEGEPSAPGRWDAGRWAVWLDADTLTGPLVVRRPRPGDRFQPLGMEGHSIKLSDFWTNHKLPRRVRAGWPLVTAGDAIVWVPGFRPAHSARVRQDTRRLFLLRLERLPGSADR